MRSSLRDRLWALGLGLPAWTVVGVAAWLEPDSRGYGTHQQLGLGTCSFMAATGWPCPMCGMTTSFTHGAELDVMGSLSAQPFGTLLFAATVAAGLVSLVELIRPAGRWSSVTTWVLDREVRVATGFVLALLAGWAYKAAQLGPVG